MAVEQGEASPDPSIGLARAARTPRIEVALRVGLRIMSYIVMPGLLAGLVMRYLVPTQAEAQGTWAEGMARVGSEHALWCTTGLFVLLSALLRYWCPRLPVGRYFAIPIPVETTRRSNTGFVVMLAVAAVAAVVARGFLFGNYQVLSASMLPTLEPEDLLGGNKLAYGLGSIGARPPARGDIVVFKRPEDIQGPDRLVKRIIGLPGDRITMNGGHAVINGWQVPSCDAGTYLYPIPGGAVRGRLSVEFLDDRAYLTVFSPSPDLWQESYDVKPGEAFVLGDNRNNSSDSRAWNRGHGRGLQVNAVEARVDWWLFGTGRDQRVDLRHFLRPLELHVRLDGMNVHSLENGIQQCLQSRPANTRPPEVSGGH
jgi:signal peptidase I